MSTSYGFVASVESAASNPVTPAARGTYGHASVPERHDSAASFRFRRFHGWEHERFLAQRENLPLIQVEELEIDEIDLGVFLGLSEGDVHVTRHLFATGGTNADFSPVFEAGSL